MKNHIHYSLFFIFCFSLNAIAQGSLKTVDEYIKNNDHEKALQQLQILLNEPAQLKGDNLPMAYILRAKTYINLLDVAVKNNSEKEIETYQNAYFQAYQDLLEAKKTATGEVVKKEVVAVSDYLHQSMRQVGANCLNVVYNNPKLSAAAQKASLDEAQKYLMAALTLKEEDYISQDFYGQVMMLKKADAMALEHFEKSTQSFKTADLKTPDFAHFRVYANMAIILLKQQNSEKALQVLTKGKENLEALYQKSKPKAADYIEKYKAIKSDLEGVEMDIYLNSPDKLPQALSKFKASINTSPNDYNLRLAYAQLLEKNKEASAAIVQYDAAVKIDSMGFLAWYNLGVLYVNQGLDFYNALPDPKNPDPKSKEKMEAIFLKAVPPLKKALEINKKDLPSIEALLTVYGRLDKKEDYLYYRKIKTELQKATSKD